MPRKRQLLSPTGAAAPSAMGTEEEREESDEIVLGTDEDEQDSICFVEIEEKPTSSRVRFNTSNARRERSASSNMIVVQPSSDEGEEDIIIVEEEEEDDDSDDVVIPATPSPPGSPQHRILPLPRPGPSSSKPPKRPVVDSDEDESPNKTAKGGREGLRPFKRRVEQSGSIKVQQGSSGGNHQPFSSLASSSRLPTSHPTQRRSPSPAGSTSSDNCFIALGDGWTEEEKISDEDVSDEEELEEVEEDLVEETGPRRTRLSTRAAPEEAPSTRKSKKGKDVDMDDTSPEPSISSEEEEDVYETDEDLPENPNGRSAATPVRTATVAHAAGQSCGKGHRVITLPGERTLPELEEEGERQYLLARRLAQRLLKSNLPWDREQPHFDVALGGDLFDSVSIGGDTFSVGDVVFFLVELKDRPGLGAGVLGSLGWFGEIVEIRRDGGSSCDEGSRSPGSTLIHWFEHAKAKRVLGGFGHQRELFRGDEETYECLSGIRAKVSVSFSKNPVDDLDLYCRLAFTAEKSSTKPKKDDFAGLKTFTYLDHETVPARPRRPGPKRLLEMFSGTGLPGLALKEAGACVPSWSVDVDPVAAATNQINSPSTRVINLDIYEFVEMLAETGPSRLEDRGIKKELDDPAFGQTGSYKRSEFDEMKGVDVLSCTSSCPPWSSSNSSKDENDPRRGLLAGSVSATQILEPSYVLFENVTGIINGTLESRSVDDDLGTALHLYISMLIEQGFSVRVKTLDARQYGSGQARERVIVIGTRRGEPLLHHPLPTHSTRSHPSRHLPPAPRIEDVVGDLPRVGWIGNLVRPLMEAYARAPQTATQRRLRGDETQVSLHRTLNYKEATKEIVRNIPKKPNSSYEDIKDRRLRPARLTKNQKNWYRRLSRRDYFRTFTTNLNPASWSGTILHYCQDRIYTIREMARGQGFPDWFTFRGTDRQKVRQIGNAVPYEIFYAIGRAMVGLVGRGFEEEEDE